MNEKCGLAGVAYHEIDSIKVREYCTTSDGSGPASEVHMLVEVSGVPYPLVMRFDQRPRLESLIEQLIKYRDVVWAASRFRSDGG